MGKDGVRSPGGGPSFFESGETRKDGETEKWSYTGSKESYALNFLHEGNAQII